LEGRPTSNLQSPISNLQSPTSNSETFHRDASLTLGMNTFTPRDEMQLVRQAQAGNAGAFAALVALHQRFVYNLALRALGNARDADDVAQEAFIRAWRGLDNFRGAAQFRTWLYRIVTNLCYTRLPRVRREFQMLSEDAAMDLPADAFSDPALRVEDQDRRAFLHREIDRLPETFRVLIMLRYQEELAYDEIAGILNIPVSAVKTGLFRARERLRARLCEYDPRQRIANREA